MILWIALFIRSIILDASYCFSNQLTQDELLTYRRRVINMFDHGFNNYLEYATGHDELKPITCDGMDTWGNFSLTLIDSLDTLILLGKHEEFRNAVDYILNNVQFDQNINVSVFETNIRVVGGLLSAHLLSYMSGMKLEDGWPCSGPLLRLAESVARKLLPAFMTKTGMPYGTVNLMLGVPDQETPITCTAGVGTFIIEFGTLSRLTGDKIFEETALKALEALHARRSKLDLLGNHINTTDGTWTAIESSIGAGVDSFYEYLVKGAMLFQNPRLMDMFKVYYAAINKYLKKDDWYFMVIMSSGSTTMPVFQSLETFFPGLLTLIGEIDQAKKNILNYHVILKRYGFLPEFFDYSKQEVGRHEYPLRPEFIESLFYLYKATKDPHLQLIAADIVESLEHSAKTECGYATIKNVLDHTIEDRMESFFLSETLKYLYLIFDTNNFVYNDGSKGIIVNGCLLESGGYVFNTEAHLIDAAAIECCLVQDSFSDAIDMYKLLDDKNALSEFQDNFFDIRVILSKEENFLGSSGDTKSNFVINKKIMENLLNRPLPFNLNRSSINNILRYYSNLDKLVEALTTLVDDFSNEFSDKWYSEIKKTNYELLKCPSLPFLLRLNGYGQVMA